MHFNMLKRSVLSIAVTAAFCAAPDLRAYDQEIHEEMTIRALDLVSKDLDFPSRIGFTVDDSVLGQSLRNHAGDGAVHQDSGLMMLNHFYDVQNDRPLTVKSLGCGSLSHRASDWAKELKQRTGGQIFVLSVKSTDRRF